LSGIAPFGILSFLLYISSADQYKENEAVLAPVAKSMGLTKWSFSAMVLHNAIMREH
jgi:hypothetical protein